MSMDDMNIDDMNPADTSMDRNRRPHDNDDAREARDRVVDALLHAHLAPEAVEVREARLARAFASLGAPAPAAPRVPTTVGAIRPTLRLARAALLVLSTTLLLAFLLVPRETSAAGLLATAASKERLAQTAGGDRRYEIALLVEPPHDEPAWLRGTWDLRGDWSRLDLTAHSLDGVELGGTTRADGPDGPWERDERGAIRTLGSRQLWPRWIEDSAGGVAVERMDDLLALVQDAYEVAFARGGDESPARLRGAMHLVATRRAPVRGPDDIELWIDTARGVVLEAHLLWDARPTDPRRSAAGRRDEREDRHSPPRGAAGPPPRVPPHERAASDEFRPMRGGLPPTPPRILELRRIEPTAFPSDHFDQPPA
ncbi:MAG: hypothetical protein RI967_1084 [Planctomycetota bacterium]